MRTIAITGAASGIGYAAAAQLAAEGHRVIGIDIANAEIEADLSNPAGRRHAVEQIRARSDVLHGFVAAAGISGSLGDAKVLSTNYFGAAELLLALNPDLARSGAGAAVMVASAGMLRPWLPARSLDACLAMDEDAAIDALVNDPRPDDAHPAYPTSKNAMARLARRLAPQAGWAGAGITLNVVVPSTTRTALTAPRLDDPAAFQNLWNATPSPWGRVAEAEEIADVIAFFVGGRARYVTGQIIFVDGGWEASRRPDWPAQPLEDWTGNATRSPSRALEPDLKLG